MDYEGDNYEEFTRLPDVHPEVLIRARLRGCFKTASMTETNPASCEARMKHSEITMDVSTEKEGCYHEPRTNRFSQIQLAKDSSNR